MIKRPILVAIIGYIIGILWGLYIDFSIILFCILIFATYYLSRKFFHIKKKRKFKLISFRRYSRYLKLIINSKVMFILIIFSIISNTIILKQNQIYENLYQDEEQVELIGIVVSQKTEKEYYDLYKVKILNSNNLNVFIQVNKKSNQLEYGDKVLINGEYVKPSNQRNYGGYDDSRYLKTLKVVGRVKANKIEVLAKKQQNIILQFGNTISCKIEEKIDVNFKEENAAILKGLLLGNTADIEDDVKEDFQVSNISHVLAISGMHVGYIILGIKMLLQKLLGKRKTKIITIVILIFYSFITGFSASITRAVIMSSIALGAGIVYRKNDIWNTISISLLGILIYNPFLILNVGLQLSYIGTIGIILFSKIVLKFFSNTKIKINEKVKEILSVTLSAQIMILPIMIYHFNKIGIYFLITNLLVSLIIGPIIILGFFYIIISFIFNPIANIIKILLNIGLIFLDFISKFSKLPFAGIYLPTPNIFMIIFYIIVVLIGRYIFSIYNLKKLTTTHIRVKNLIALFRYKFKENKKKCKKIILTLIVIIISINFIPKDLKIYFVDVGQGDCTFIITPNNKTILIDGGGSISDSFDVGKKTLIPYLLDRGYTSLDYIMISHFDQDHVGGILTVLEEIKVKNVIISKQGEESKQYSKFLDIVKQKKINVIVVERGNRVKIEDSIYFDILWPQKEQIKENILNNNSIVTKLHYGGFSMLFTGDIEKEAEEIILKKKTNLKSDILKVAHHGSNSSSTQDFIKAVNPNIALIGVGQNNNFGHPNSEVLNRLKQLGVKIFRTNEDGEINFVINGKGKIKEKMFICTNNKD